MNDPAVWFRFLIAVLATWRVTHLVAREDGPGDLIVRVRRRLGHGWAGRMMDCFYCLSVWVAAPAALFVSYRAMEWLFAWLAISGAACLLERIGGQPVLIQSEPEGGSNHVLRTDASAGNGAENGNGAGGENSTSSTHTRTAAGPL